MANKYVIRIVGIVLIFSYIIKINADDDDFKADAPCFAQFIYPPCEEVGEMVIDCIVNLRCDYKLTIFNELEPNSTIRKCVESWITECTVANHANPLIRCIDKTYFIAKRFQSTGPGAPCKNFFGLAGYCEYKDKCESAQIEYNTHFKSNLYLQYVQDSNCNTEEQLVVCCAPTINPPQETEQTAENEIPSRLTLQTSARRPFYNRIISPSKLAQLIQNLLMSKSMN